jgi:hypothetical protein
MGGTSKGLSFTFETSLKKDFLPPINKGPLYANKKKKFEYFYVVQFVFEKPYFSKNSLCIHSKCCTSLLLRSSTINYSPLCFHFQPLLEEAKLCILGLKSLPKEEEGTHKFPYFSKVLSI